MNILQEDPPAFIHPKAIVDTQKIGRETRIWGWTHVQEDVVIGDCCNVGEHCFIENGVRIGHRVVIKNGISIWNGTVVEDDAFLGPSVIFTNERFPRAGFRKEWEGVRVCRGATIGAGVVLLPGVIIGRYSTVGAGSVVTRDVEPHALVFGNPAQDMGWMCGCGLKLKTPEAGDVAMCGCGRKYRVLGGKCELVEG